jgi:hypothetical protein
MSRLKHVPGSRFGRLVIISRDGVNIHCQCDCGRSLTVRLSNLCTGHTSSCGCLRKEVTVERSTIHGYARRGNHEPTYECWSGMLKRCMNPKDKSWPDYGGRGITVCEQWLSFENFLADMGERPIGRSIDRKDVNGPYCKANCSWATRKEQNRNTRRNRFLTLNGRTQTLAAWAEELDISHTSILARLKRGWSLAEALTKRSGD